MAKAPGLTMLQQDKILAYASMKMSLREIVKAVRRSMSVTQAFPKDPEGYGTKKNTGRPLSLKVHGHTRLKRVPSTGEYTANQIQQKLGVEASVRTVQREL